MKLTKRIGTMAVVIDEAAEKAEFLNCDQIGIVSVVINAITGVAHFGLAFGGLDSSGKFHIDMNRAQEVASITISRDADPGAFDALFCDNGQLKCNFPHSFFDQLAKEVLIPVAHKQIWGGKHPDMEVTRNGELIFSTEKKGG